MNSSSGRLINLRFSLLAAWILTKQGNYIEFENIVGEPLREAEILGVPTPSLKMLYGLLKIKQLQIKEKKGLVSMPMRDNP